MPNRAGDELAQPAGACDPTHQLVWAVDLIREAGLVKGMLQARLRKPAYLHLWEITRKYSRGSSANNHRIGEAAGVFIASSYFPDLDHDGRWQRESRQILDEEIIAPSPRRIGCGSSTWWSFSESWAKAGTRCR